MVALADIVKLSDEDLHWLDGPGPVTVLAQAMLRRGPQVVMITAGAEGATAHTARGQIRVGGVQGSCRRHRRRRRYLQRRRPRRAAPRRPAEQGRRGGPLDDAALTEALTLGVRAAAITVSRPGADPPWAREL